MTATLIEAIKPLLNSESAKLDLSIESASAEQIQVTVKPITKPLPQNAGQELTQIMAALAVPVKVVGGTDEVEAKLVEVITQASEQRNEWAVRAADLNAAIEQGRQHDQKKNTTASATQSKGKAQGDKAKADTQSQDNTGAAEQQGATETGQSAPDTGTTNQSPMLDL